MRATLTLAARLVRHNVLQSWRWLVFAFLAVYLIWGDHWIFSGESVSAFHFQPRETIFSGIFVAQGVSIIYGFWATTKWKTPRLPILTADSLRNEGVRPAVTFDAGALVLWGWLFLCGVLTLAVASYHPEIRLNYRPYYSATEQTTLTGMVDVFAGAALVPDPEHGLARGGSVVIPRGQLYLAIASLYESLLVILWVQFVAFRIRSKPDWVFALIIVIPAFLLEMTGLFAVGDGALVYHLIRDWPWYWGGALLLVIAVHFICRAKFNQTLTARAEVPVVAPAASV